MHVVTICAVLCSTIKVKEVKLITNNPLKIQALKDQGINVVDRVPLTVGRNPFNEQYLKPNVKEWITFTKKMIFDFKSKI